MTTIIKTITRDEDTIEDYEYRDAMEIFIGDKRVFKVADGEPEDSNMSRDFSDVWKITEMLQVVYDMGRRGCEVSFISEESSDI
jgi:hypothetical protein